MKFTAQIQRLAYSVQRIVIVLLLATCYLLPVTSVAHAQTSNLPTNTNPDVPNNMHTWTQGVMLEVISAMTCEIAGVDPTNPKQACLGIDHTTGKIGYVKNGGGAIGLAGNMIAMTFNIPIHTSDYTQYVAQNFGIAKPAYAQTTGSGYIGLSPLIPVWSAFRNIVYLLFVLVFVIIGFGIMWRIHMDPRTVMTIANQLPNIIIAMLLVTFSFAIAGLLVDLMYVTTYVTTNIIATADTQNNTLITTTNKNLYSPPVGFANELYNTTGAGGILSIALHGAGGVQGIVSSLFAPDGFGEAIKAGQDKTSDCKGFDPGCWFNKQVGGTIGKMLSDIIGWLISWILGVLAFLIIIVALLWALMRLWFQLISAYIFILLDVVLAPFWIVAGIIPGSELNFGAWIRDIVANLSAFPVTIVLFSLGKVFIDNFSSANSNTLFIPPLIGNPNATGSVGPLIGIGIILLTPQVAAMMRRLLKAPEFKEGAAIGQALGVGPGIATGGFNAVFSPYGSLQTMTRATDFWKGATRGGKFNIRGGVEAITGQHGGPQVGHPPAAGSKS